LQKHPLPRDDKQQQQLRIVIFTIFILFLKNVTNLKVVGEGMMDGIVLMVVQLSGNTILKKSSEEPALAIV
jgi:hypothetical protein